MLVFGSFRANVEPVDLVQTYNLRCGLALTLELTTLATLTASPSESHSVTLGNLAPSENAVLMGLRICYVLKIVVTGG